MSGVSELAGSGRTGRWDELLSAPASRWRDVLGSTPSFRVDWRDAVGRGGFPVPAHELSGPADRARWFAGYVQTCLERDLPVLRAVEHLADFRRLAQAACLRVGSLLNQAELGRDAGLSQPQVHGFLNVLEASFLAVRLPAFAVTRTKRLIKAPKMYWCDTARALHLSGDSEPRGAHLENLVLLDLLAWRDLKVPRPEVLYWRRAGGAEVFPLTRRVLAAPWWSVL